MEKKIACQYSRLRHICKTGLKKRLLKKTQIVLFAARSRPVVARRTAGTSKKASTRVLTVVKSDVEWAAHLGRNVLG
ncbi:hypothetical protein, partial [Dyella sp. S184]|uniref:hypothetical protein n=1 Tax=Dyella sp. S184 TaxID=1641862 RepID=UPI001C2082D6